MASSSSSHASQGSGQQQASWGSTKSQDGDGVEDYRALPAHKLSQYAYEGSIAYTKGYISLFRRTRSSLIRVHHCPWIWKEARVLSEQIDFHENPPAAQVDFHENP